MNSRPCLSYDDLPLFHTELGLWNRLDESVRKQVLDSLGLLLLQYLSQTIRGADEEPSPRKGNQP